MKKRNLLAMMLMGFALFFGACSDDDTPEPTPVTPDVEITEAEMDAVIATYVDKVVIPTYAEMENKVSAMSAAVEKYLASETQADLDAACNAWRNARKPWEESEAFLYGPADYENLDPSLDSWPLDKDGLDQLLASQNWDEIEGDDEDAQSLRGFHTIEYLMFEDGKPKKTENITANERAYMKRVSDRLLKDTQLLHKAWTTGLGEGSDVVSAFGEEMKKHTSIRTSSAKNVLGEFIIYGGIQVISDEVGTAKIGEPYNEWKSGNEVEAVLQVESWYSWNSLTDYVDNIISIENSYMGGRKGNRDSATSMSELVKKVNPELDAEVQAQIAATIKAIEDIPAPFRSHLNAKTEIEAAMEACSELTLVFDKVKAALDLN